MCFVQIFSIDFGLELWSILEFCVIVNDSAHN